MASTGMPMNVAWPSSANESAASGLIGMPLP